MMFIGGAKVALLLSYAGAIHAQYFPPIIPNFKPEKPRPVPKYMVDNTANTYGYAPDNNIINGPNVSTSYIQAVGNSTDRPHEKRAGSFWVDGVTHGQSPFADDSDYKIFRNVMVSFISPLPSLGPVYVLNFSPLILFR
jgi:hypothetical protein